MSNMDLQAEVSRLRSELNAIERENAALRSEIGSAVNSVNQADRDLKNYNEHIRSSLDNATGSINNSINRALGAYELQGQIDQLYTRYKCVELANKKIRALNNKKYYEFNNFRTIRKIVTGIMDNLDLNMVNDRIIYKSVERQHLVTPDYWLTPALVAVMAWKSDDKNLAERALEEAVRLDKKNSCMFFLIFNMRMDRNEAAVKWFLEYQKCALKGSDENTFLMMFSLISKTLTDSVDDETARMIADYIHRLIMECAEREGYSEDHVVGFICNKMQAMARPQSYELPTLSSYCTDYDQIKKMLDLAGNNYNILEMILKIVNVPIAERNTYLKEYLNDLLAKPNDVEIETYNEIEYNELVIKMGGDVDRAKEIFNSELARRESDFDIISTIIRWIYDYGNENINGQMRLNMFTLTKTLQDKAATAYIDGYRSMYSNVKSISIQDYFTQADFTNQAGENAKVENFYLEKEREERAAVKNIGAYIAFGAGALCIGGAIALSQWILLAGLGIGGAIGAGILIANNFKRKNISLKIHAQKENVLEILRKLFVEFDKMKDIYKGYDEISAKISEEIAKL